MARTRCIGCWRRCGCWRAAEPDARAPDRDDMQREDDRMTASTPRPGERFTDWLKVQAEPAFGAAVGHRFARDLADGTIPPQVFRRYLVQDYSFLDHFIRLLDAALAPTPEAAARERYTAFRSEEHTSELQSLMRISYAVFCLKKKN